MKKFFCFVMCVPFLMSCTERYSSSGENLYLRSKNGVKLEVPAPLTQANISDFYNLPSQNQDARINIERSM